LLLVLAGLGRWVGRNLRSATFSRGRALGRPRWRAREYAIRVARAAERAAVAHLGELLPAIIGSQDAAEGVRSFVERLNGRFTGR
jgi:hypothetical protein